LKFLKSGASEAGAIKTALKGLALAHPQVSFRLRIENDLSFFYPAAKSRLQRVEQVFENQGFLVGAAGDDGSKVEAVFASPEVTLKTSKGMWFFAQNRWIQDRTLQASVMEAFRSTLMHGEYPMAAVWVDVPPDEVDVNIHPTKSQVKFLNQSKLFRLVGAAIRPKLESYQSAKQWSPPVETSLSFPQFEATRTQYQVKNFEISTPAQNSVPSMEISSPVEAPILRKGPWSQLQIIGQSHLTYIVTQSRDQLVIVDQHAAHERVLFETIMQGWREGKLDRQDLLFPLSIDLGADKVEALVSLKADLEKLGLRVEALGLSTLGVSSIPAVIKESSLPPILDRIATEMLEQGGTFTFERKVSDLAASMACHSAIRAGQSLSLPEMGALLESMDQYSFSSFCPHGRPVSISKSLMDIEKDFGRRNA
jgi:DNA mismatch repair protein MutL